MEAEKKNAPLPYSNEELDPMLVINVVVASQQSGISSKLKKSLSNAEDRRRKSLLPWNRRMRSKSKDRDEEKQSIAKTLACSTNTLKHNSAHSIGDVHSSRSSLSSFDAAVTKTSNFDDDTKLTSLCRVILRENGATTIVQIKPAESLRDLVEKVLDKRGFSYQAYEVFLSGTNKVKKKLNFILFFEQIKRKFFLRAASRFGRVFKGTCWKRSLHSATSHLQTRLAKSENHLGQKQTLQATFRSITAYFTQVQLWS
jgi:Raf-like Ras-binding domain